MPVRSAASLAARDRNVRSSAVASRNATKIDTPALTQVPTSMPVSAPSMAAQTRTILFDALGTLIGFEPPAPHLRVELRTRGHEVSERAAERAIRAEIAYYRAHLHEGRDPEA